MMKRIEALRRAALTHCHGNDEFFYRFYKHYGRYGGTPDLPRYADAFFRAFSTLTPQISSGELIDRAGLKGTRIGDAMISEVHAGFIVNLGAASSADVYALAETARSTVLSRFGIPLSYEIEFLGDIP